LVKISTIYGYSIVFQLKQMFFLNFYLIILKHFLTFLLLPAKVPTRFKATRTHRRSSFNVSTKMTPDKKNKNTFLLKLKYIYRNHFIEYKIMVNTN